MRIVVTEAIKLAFADRERYYGDPRFVKVPIETLLPHAYAANASRHDRTDRAWPENAAGWARSPVLPARRVARADRPSGGARDGGGDTSYVCVMDGWQRILGDAQRRRGTGRSSPDWASFPSARGSQSWAVTRAFPCSRAGQATAPDAQSRARAMRRVADASAHPAATCRRRASAGVPEQDGVRDEPDQQAVEAPRFASYSFPDSSSRTPTYPRAAGD